MNGDGLLDLAFANQGASIDIHLGQRARPDTGSAVVGPRVVIYAPEGNERRADSDSTTLAPADFYAGVDVQSSGVITIPYWLVDPAERPVTGIKVSYALSGTQWIPAIPVSGTQVTDLAAVASIQNAEPHYFYWDTTNLTGKGFFGQSDTVVVRIRTLPDLTALPGEIAGSYQQGSVATQSFPFRVAGNQSILVMGPDGPVEGAMVMRQAKGAKEALLMESGAGETLLTGSDGILRGLGPLEVGDYLIALAPVTNTHAFALYHTSGKPTLESYALQRVAEPGVQTLVITETSPLVVYDLDISLEWDARSDPEFLANFDNAIKRASGVLFDLTNGQAMLGNVRLFQNRENWVFSDVVVYASNSIHPRASMGGVVLDAVDDIDKDGNVIKSAYLPGQIHMGPFWDPFGQSQQELQQDWWRAFAHELGHYLLFLPDNYLGVEEKTNARGDVTRVFRTTNCVGSFMTNAYDENNYGEFLIADDPNWTGEAEGSECQNTVAAKLLTGRADWETITSKLNWNMLDQAPGDGDAVDGDAASEDRPMIFAPKLDQLHNTAGPYGNPLSITRLTQMPLISDGGDEPTIIASGYYDIRDENNTLAKVRQAQAYLYHVDSRTGESGEKIDDVSIIALGSTGRGADRIRVRGAEVGDRLCIYDAQSTPPRAGCESQINENTQTVNLKPVPGWSPDITVTPVSSRTMIISVTQEISGVDATQLEDFTGDSAAGQPDAATARSLMNALDRSALRVQAIPAYGPWQASHEVVSTFPTQVDLQSYAIENTSAVSDSLSTVTLEWTKVITIDYPSFEGFVRVWEPGDQDGRDGGSELFPGTELRESITQYYLSVGWGPNSRGLNPVDTRVWGPNSRGLNPTNSRYWGPNSRGLNPADSRTWGPNSRGLNPVDTRVWGPNSRGLNPTDSRYWGPNSRGLNPTNIRSWGSNNRTMEAPIASGDGRVTIFNMDDILADPGATALQSLSDPPSLDPWLTPVGKAYRFTAEAGGNGNLRLTISFHYLTRDVPAGYENALAVYYQPSGGDAWQRLPTDLYPDENMAVAVMPTEREGTYALVATVELPSVQPGWNILAYTVPQDRDVSAALASLDGAYSAVYGYEPQSEPGWSLFDPDVDSLPAFTGPANSLSVLEYGHGYIIHITATHPVTPYLAVPDVTSVDTLVTASPSLTAQLLVRSEDDLTVGMSRVNDLAIAPATIAGMVVANSQSSNIEGREISAIIVDAENGRSRVCGQGVIRERPGGGGHYYAVQVRSDSQESGCGTEASIVELRFGKDTILATGLPWDNTDLIIQSLVIP